MSWCDFSTADRELLPLQPQPAVALNKVDDMSKGKELITTLLVIGMIYMKKTTTTFNSS
jgi:hypothetical protein